VEWGGNMNIDELIELGYNNEGLMEYQCPLCGGLITSIPNVFYCRCSTCLATLITYKPAPHQIAFHQSKAKFRLNIGGYGSGKTTADVSEISSHALSVPNGRTLIMAQTLQQLKEAALPELDKFLPPWFLDGKPTQTKYKLTNGHEILLWASDKAEKIRSLNLSAFLLVEASGIDYTVFTTAQSRLRNNAAVVRDKTGKEIGDMFMGLVETNPEEGWVRDEFLLRSSVIMASANVDTSAYDKIKSKKSETQYHSFLSASIDNPYLSVNYVPDLCVGKTEKWIKKYIYCYLEVREGAVYPDFANSLCDPIPIPDKWLRLYGFDKGWSDETCLPCGAIDADKGILYIYDDYYQKEKPISYHAAQIRERIHGTKMYKNIQADPSIRQKNDRDGVSYQDYFYNVSGGIYLEPGNNAIFDGIERVRDFMYTGKLKIFTSCVNIKEEAQAYVWKKDRDGSGKDEPVEKKNHLMDAIRYMVMALPIDLRDVRKDMGTSSTKNDIMSKLTPNNTVDEILNEIEDGFGGVYGFGG
jgi:PBSX family phage terminase large subunit